MGKTGLDLEELLCSHLSRKFLTNHSNSAAAANSHKAANITFEKICALYSTAETPADDDPSHPSRSHDDCINRLDEEFNRL